MQSDWLRQFHGKDTEVSRRKFMQSSLVAGVAAGMDGDMNEMRFYNGVTEAEMADAYGLKKLGVEHCKPFFTRGVVIDVAGLKGRMMNAGEEITVADVQGALQRQKI